MSSWADLALADRDPGLPGLRILLDEAALSAWVSDRTGSPCRVRSSRIRYKPSLSCVLAFDLQRPGDEGTAPLPCLARTYSDRSAVKAAKAARRTPPDALVALDLDIPLVVTTLAGDRDLPALTRLHDRQARERLLHRVLPERQRLSTLSPRTVRHNPERRWVGVLDDPSGPPVVLRAYRRSVMPGPARAYEQLANGSPRTPPLLGWSHRHGLAAVAWVDGREVSRDLSDLDSFAAAGRALGHLHERQGVRLRSEDPLTQADAVRAAATTVATLLPDLSPEATEVARRLGADIGRCVPGSVLHGDFSADQVIRGDDGAVTLIDLDGARLGEPSVDLACAAAALAETDADEPGRRALAAMYSGYESVRPLPARRRLSVLGSAHLLRKATEPFRNREPDWPDRMRELCRLAALEESDRATGRERGPW